MCKHQSAFFRHVRGIFAFVLVLGLGACAQTPTPGFLPTRVSLSTAAPAAAASPTLTATRLPPPTATLTPTPKNLVICTHDLPPGFYRYFEDSYIGRNIRNALGSRAILEVGWTYHPTILEKLPSLVDGDVLLWDVQVRSGDAVWDAEAGRGTYQGPETTMSQMIVTFRLVEGPRWADIGTPVTAHDSVYAYEAVRWLASREGRQPPVPARMVDGTAGYRALDDRTVEWTGLPGYTPQDFFLHFFDPLPRHRLQMAGVSFAEIEDFSSGGLPALSTTLAPTHPAIPVGWGPFRIVKWIPGTRMVLERNPYYWRAAEGLPKVDRVAFDLNTPADDYQALQQGRCHVGSLDPVTQYWTPGAEAQVSDLTWQIVSTHVWEHLTFNLAPMGERPPFFADRRVRQAIAHAINRSRLIQETLAGHSPVPDSYLHPHHPLHAEGLPVYEHDPERARSLLAEAGWVDSDGDGVVEKDGAPFVASLMTTEGRFLRERAVRLIVEDLAEVGVRVEPEFLPASKLFADAPDGPLFGRRFDLALFAWMTGIEPPCDLYLSVGIPGERNGWVGQNNAGYANPDYDIACHTAQTSLDTASVADTHREAQHLFARDLPALPLYFRPQAVVHRPEVTGLVFDPLAGELWNIDTIDLK